MLEQCAQRLQVEDVIAFDTLLPSGSPVYHTNVMMSVGPDYAILCSSVIDPSRKDLVLQSLSDKEVIDISLEQLSAFCGNVLQLHNQDGESGLAMSSTAFHAFTDEQKEKLSQFGELLSFDVQTIESVGGGSVRCMLAEIFL